jgi:hypothetical protein
MIAKLVMLARLTASAGYDTEDTEKASVAINWTACGLTKRDMYNSFALHDNDYGSHVFNPYVVAVLLGPFLSFSLSIAYESTSVTEHIYGVGIFHSSSSYTGIVDGLLQDPIAGFIGVLALIIHAHIHRRTIAGIRKEFLGAYGQVGVYFNWETLGFIVFTVTPLLIGHNVYEWMGFTTSSGALHLWAMSFSVIVPVLYALCVCKTPVYHTLGFRLMAEVWAVILAGQSLSYIGLNYTWPDPLQSTPFWTAVTLSLHMAVMFYNNRLGKYSAVLGSLEPHSSARSVIRS